MKSETFTPVPSTFTAQETLALGRHLPGSGKLFGIPWEDLPEPAESPALVGDLFYLGTLSMLVGPSGIGKTVFVLQLAKCVVKGVPFQERDVPYASPVLLIDNEMGRRGLYRYSKEVDMTGQFMALHDVPAADLVPVIKAAIDEGCKLVIIDSYLSLAADSVDGSGDPLNSAVITEKLLKPLLTLAHDTDICILIVHHTNKDAETFSGSQRIKSLPDEMYFLTLDEFSQTRTLKASKNRNGIKPLSWKAAGHPDFAKAGTGPTGEGAAVEPAKIQQREEFVLSLLADGPVDRSTVKTRCQEMFQTGKDRDRALERAEKQLITDGLIIREQDKLIRVDPPAPRQATLDALGGTAPPVYDHSTSEALLAHTLTLI